MSKKTAATHYHLPAEITDQHIAILGKTGSGKTFTAKGYVERLIKAGRRVCIFDPAGIWWGLRYTPALKPGLRVPIAGGDAGDIQNPNPHALAQYVGKMDGALLVDISEYLIGNRHVFAEDFFKTLYQANRRPLHLIIDEADEVAPQNPLPETRRMLHQVDRIVRRGRTRGFIVTMISQRPAVLHKNVLSQANTLIAMQLTSSQDKKAVDAWIKGQADVATGKQILASLPRLQQGQGYVWSPQFDVLERVRFPLIETADTSATPKHDEEPLRPPSPLSYAGQFKDLAALETEVPADPALQPKRRGRDRAAVPPGIRPNFDIAGTMKKVENEAFARGREEGRREGYAQGRADGTGAGRAAVRAPLLEMRKVIASLGTEMDTLAKSMELKHPPVETVPAPSVQRAPPPRELNRAPHASADATPGVELPESTLRVLAVLASRYPAKFTVGEWAALAGLAPRGGSWGQHYRTLKAAGLISEGNGEVQAAPAALALTGGVQVSAATRAELIELWQGKLGGQTRALLEALLEAGDDGLDRAQMAAIVGMAERGGAFQKLVRGLVRNQLAERRGDLYFAGSVLDV